jgi:hypothetical protein
MPQGVADGIAAMIGLVELQHYAFHRGMQNLIGIDASAGQRVVLLLRHGKNEPVRDDRAFCRRGKSCEMLTPAFGDPQFPIRIGNAWRARRVRSIGIDADVIVEKPADVNLPEGFLRDVAGKMFELFPNLLIHVLPFPQRNFSAGSLVEIFQIQTATSCGLASKNLPVFHNRD